MRYFIKDFKVHKYPVPKSCKSNYLGEKLFRTSPLSFEECRNCFPEHPI